MYSLRTRGSTSLTDDEGGSLCSQTRGSTSPTDVLVDDLEADVAGDGAPDLLLLYLNVGTWVQIEANSALQHDWHILDP